MAGNEGMRSFSAGDTIRITLEFESEAEVGRGMAIFHHESDPYWSLTFIGDAEPIAGENGYRMHLSSYITDNLSAGEYRFSYMRGERYGGQQDGLELAFDGVPDIRVVLTGESRRCSDEPAVAPRALGWDWEYWDPSPPVASCLHEAKFAALHRVSCLPVEKYYVLRPRCSNRAAT